MAPVPGDSPKTPAWHIDAARGPAAVTMSRVREWLETIGLAHDQHR
jgi:hypothetical protein